MNAEHIKISIDTAVDLLQLITEDVEINFLESDLGRAITARASIMVSGLNILADYLRGLSKELDKEGV